LADLDVVTGAFSYSGRAIATELLARGREVRTLSRRVLLAARVSRRCRCSVPVFLVPGGDGYRVQPVAVAVADLARLAVDAVGSRARLVHAPPAAILALARVFDVLARDVLLTRDELEGLRASLLTSEEPPRGTASFRAWVESHGRELGRSCVSELARNFRSHAPL
jgi:NAD(P)-dependent dehydrogenase (short-subunit alcohol dehydrogenase family)